MSSLARYKKPGGFKSLLMLIESSNQKKKDQLLGIVEQEDPRWAKEIRDRMLTIDKVLAWDGETIEKVVGTLPANSWVTALFHLEEGPRKEQIENITKFMGSTRQREVLDSAGELTPSPGEVEAAQLLIIKKVRDMQAAGEFRPEQYDPLLTLSELDQLVM